MRSSEDRTTDRWKSLLFLVFTVPALIEGSLSLAASVRTTPVPPNWIPSPNRETTILGPHVVLYIGLLFAVALCLLGWTAWTIWRYQGMQGMISAFLALVAVWLLWDVASSALSNSTYVCISKVDGHCSLIQSFQPAGPWSGGTDVARATWLFSMALVATVIAFLGAISRVVQLHVHRDFGSYAQER